MSTTKKQKKTAAAKNLLENLGAPQDQGNAQPQEPVVSEPPALDPPAEQLPEQTGKGALPPPATQAGEGDQSEDQQTTEEPSEPIPVDEDQDNDNETQEAEPVFTDQDRKDLPCLEGEFQTTGIRQAKALRAIRQRKLWMLHRNDQGVRKYTTFDDYMEERWGHTRQWATQQTKWLATVETLANLRAQGANVPDYVSANAVSGLWQLDAAGGYQGSTDEEQEEQGLIAVLQEAQADGLTLSRDNLRAICQRRAKYYRSRQDHRPFAAATYPDYKQDCLVAAQLGNPGAHGLVADAQRLPGDFGDNLIKVCTEQNKLPRADELLQAVTGTALEEIVARLNTLAQEIADVEAKKNLLKTRKAQIRAMQQEGGLAQLRQEAKALQSELQEKGVLKKRAKAKPEDSPADDQEEVEDETNQVQDSLEEAFTYLEEAFLSDWPEHEVMLQAVLDSAKKCEDKLAEITDKAKGLLADATLEPSSVASLEA